MNRPPKPLAVLLAALVLLYGVPSLVFGQATQPASAAAPQGPTFKPEELEQVVAPIALYPDPLLAQVFMASTYPLEIVQAARWVKENPNVTGKALEDAMQKQPWDPSVKSLTAFPQVLTMMNEKLDWTQKLGDAFLAQQSDVMDAVQRLRAKAQAQGALETTKQQKVVVEQAPPPPANVEQNVNVQQAPAPPTTIIKIEPADPQVVYVPTYNPTVVYGAWPYPAYPPPAPYYPPGYVATASLLSFGAGMAVGAALWGNCNWGGGYGNNNVNINTNNYNNFNKTNVANGNWQHNVDHRKGVQYRDKGTQQRYGRGQTQGAQSRDAFRGRAEAGRQDIARGGADSFKGRQEGGHGAADRAGGQRQGAQSGANRAQSGVGKGNGAGPAAANRQNPAGGAKGGSRQPAANRPQPQPQRQTERSNAPSDRGAGAFQGTGNNGQQTRADSNRGRTSRESAATRGGGGGGGRVAAVAVAAGALAAAGARRREAPAERAVLVMRAASSEANGPQT